MAKKRLSLLNKILFLINTIVAIALVISLFIPNLIPKKFGMLALWSLLTPIFIIVNFCFVIYWILIGFKKQLILSFFVLLLSFLLLPPVYKLYGSTNKTSKDSVTIMTYNVRKFNRYKWIDIENIDARIADFITTENPDIVALQEFRTTKNFDLQYPYYFNYRAKNKKPSGLIIYSKYPILHKGLLGNHNFSSGIQYIDIAKKNDTLRIYNFHLESLGIVPDKEYFGHKNSERLVKRLTRSFKTQQAQIDTLNAHIKNCHYKIVLVGDMNNTAYSWAYKNIKNDFQDSFLETGKGFGKTYTLKKMPLRIDYIFADKRINFIRHKNYGIRYSDHYPLSATINF